MAARTQKTCTETVLRTKKIREVCYSNRPNGFGIAFGTCTPCGRVNNGAITVGQQKENCPGYFHHTVKVQFSTRRLPVLGEEEEHSPSTIPADS